MVELNEARAAENVGDTFRQTLLCLCRATPHLIASPMLPATFLHGIIRRDFSSPRFMGRDVVDVLSAMSRERTEIIESFPPGPTVIIANHPSLFKLLPAVARRIPQDEEMPYIFADIAAPLRTYLKSSLTNPTRLIAWLMIQLEATLPFILPSLKNGNDGLSAELSQVTNRDISAYSYMALGRKVITIKKEDSSPSFLVCIEGRASEGTSLYSPDKDLVRLTNLLLKHFQGAPLIFLAYNPKTHKAKTIEVVRTQMMESPDSEFYHRYLQQAMDKT